jgi:hypothetical protein
LSESGPMIFRFAVFFVFLQTLGALAMPTGVFLVGESEGDDFHHVLRLEPDQATIRDFTGDGSSARTLTFAITPVGEDQYQLLGSEHGQPVRGYLRFTSDNEAVLWFSGHTRLYWALRTAPSDLSPLQGHWSALARQDIWEVDITDQKFELLRGEDKSTWSLHPVTNHSAEIRAVARPDDTSEVGREESYLLYFIQLGPDFWLVRNHEEDHFLMLFREGSRPMMEAELKKRLEDASSEEDDDL